MQLQNFGRFREVNSCVTMLGVWALASSFVASPPRHSPSRTRHAAAAPRMIVDELAPVVFEAQFNPSQLGITAFAIAVPFGYWWYITVPEARLSLAKDKRKSDGEVKQYLDELQSEPDGRPVERWFLQKWLRQNKPARTTAAAPAAEPVVSTTMAATTASLEAAAAAPDAPAQPTPAEQQRDPSLRELFAPASLKGNATPRFWSGDNPIVVTTGTLLTLGVVSTIVREGGTGAVLLDAAVVGAGLVFGLTRLQLK